VNMFGEDTCDAVVGACRSSIYMSVGYLAIFGMEHSFPRPLLTGGKAVRFRRSRPISFQEGSPLGDRRKIRPHRERNVDAGLLRMVVCFRSNRGRQVSGSGVQIEYHGRWQCDIKHNKPPKHLVVVEKTSLYWGPGR